jgi:hypothetical protein
LKGDLLTTDAFRGLYKDDQELFKPHTTTSLPMIHVHCFQVPAIASEAILNEVREALGYEIGEKELTIHNVRNVSPNKVRIFSDGTNLRTCIVAHLDFHQK